MTVSVADLDGHRRDLAETATAWVDRWYDEEVGLPWNPPGSFDAEGLPGLSVHLVQQAGWYATGLLLRDGPGDADRAARIVEVLCDIQYDEPGTPWHGTFRRFHEWPHPQPGARMWHDYDPNWRQFVGTTFALLLRRFPGRLPEDRMRGAIARAVDGEPADRVPPTYSNIALMKAWLEVFVGRVDDGEALARAVVEGFRAHGAFEEYNSPTYYGVVLYALALWRSESESSRLRAWGTELADALWHDIGRHWHAGLGNMAGPFTRAYGLDMNSYASHAATWVWAGVGRHHTPFPPLEGAVEHGHDFCFGPMAALLGAEIPAAVQAELRSFSGERLVEQVVAADPLRVATSWLAEGVMIGAESSEHDWQGWVQYVPGVVHWRAADGSVAWLRLRHRGVVDARAEPGRLVAECRGPEPVRLLTNVDLPFDTRLPGPGRIVIEVDDSGPVALHR